MFPRLLHTDQGQEFLFSPTKLVLVPLKDLLRTVVVQINCTTAIFYLSNRPLFLWVYRRNKPHRMLGEHEESL